MWKCRHTLRAHSNACSDCFCRFAGQYAEYVCSETGDEVCSRRCKEINLAMRAEANEDSGAQEPQAGEKTADVAGNSQ